MTYEFKDTIKVAEEGEKHIELWLERFGYHIISVANDKNYQEQDIDLVGIKIDKSGKTVVDTFEVKVDRYDSNNFFLETVSNKEKGTIGCQLYSNSDFIVYYFINKKVIYTIPTWKLRKYILNNLKRFTTKECDSKTHRSKGLLVDIKTLEQELNVKGVRL